MKYLVQALLEITAWILLPIVLLEVSYRIARNNVASYLKENGIKVKNGDFN